MSRVFTIFLIALYSITLSQAYMPHLNYWMNRDYIIAELCENKDRPELHCDGKCQLKKDILETEESRDEDQEVTSPLMLEFVEEADALDFKRSEMDDLCLYGIYSEPLVSGVSGSVFRPPKA